MIQQRAQGVEWNEGLDGDLEPVEKLALNGEWWTADFCVRCFRSGYKIALHFVKPTC